MSGRSQRMFVGIGASPGGALGKVNIFTPQKVSISRRPIEPHLVDEEIARLHQALDSVTEDIHELGRQVDQDKSYQGIFAAYEMILEDHTVVDQAVDIIKQWKYPAAYAYSLAMGQMLSIIENLSDERISSRARDLKDLKDRVVEKLTGKQENPLSAIDKECILVAHDLSPSDTALMRRDLVKAIVTEVGSMTSHTSILAQALHIPAVVATANIIEFLRNGDTILVDGYNGAVIVEPHTVAVEAMERSWDRARTREKAQLENVELPAATIDGFRTEVSVNIELTEEIEKIKQYGGEGVGLYRTEFLYINQKELPSEEEQYDIYSRLATSVLPYHAIIRTVDLGGDKFASNIGIPTEVNPFLGWRGIRLSLARQDMFRTQLRAILRASVNGRLRLMFPMISDVSEVIAAKKILLEEKDDLIATGIAVDPDIEVGIMIEVPSAALTVQLLAKHVDFFSIGTNDLIQYTLAVERGNERIAYLYQPFHPSIVGLIKHIIDVAHRNYIWVGLCGEMASYPLAVPLLIGMGLDEFSVAPRTVPQVKQIIRSLSYEKMREMVRRVTKLTDAADIRNEVCNSIPREVLEGIL